MKKLPKLGAALEALMEIIGALDLRRIDHLVAQGPHLTAKVHILN